MSKQSISEKLFKKYEFLALEYAKKVFNYQRLAMEVDDIKQEFRIKLYQVILAYGRSMSRFKETGMMEPIPLEFYIRSSMNNFRVDFIKEIESDKSKTLYQSHNEEHDFAYYNNDMINIDFTNNVMEINGFDMLQSLKGIEKNIFCMYCKGVEMEKLVKMFNKVADVKEVITNHTKFLTAKKHEYYPENKMEIFVKNYQQ